MKVLTDTDIVSFFMSWELPKDPKDADRLLQRIIEIAEVASVEVWNRA